MIPKFRAWEESAEEGLQMWSWKEMCEIGLGQLFNNPKYELMQSTGLKDKNGVEIFEGDIVRVTDDDERTDFSDGGIGTVCGLEELYMWYIDGEVDNGLFDISQSYYIEVLGNIYENTELVEVQE